MIPAAYYNEFDPETAAWLAENIRAGLIMPGDVDTRSITEVSPDDLKGYTQHHFFAGVGGWSFAARLAGWHDARPLWSASLPCQPFSKAGRRLGTDDSRHLWPDFYRLCDAFRPPAIVGEQVAGEDGLGWFDGVSASLEAGHYASRAVVIPACAVDSPQQRERTYWVAVDEALLDMAYSEGERGGAGLRGGGARGYGRLEPTDDYGGGRSLDRALGEGMEGYRGSVQPGRSGEDRRDAPANVGDCDARVGWPSHGWHARGNLWTGIDLGPLAAAWRDAAPRLLGDPDLVRELEPGWIQFEGGGRAGDATALHGEALDSPGGERRGAGGDYHGWHDGRILGPRNQHGRNGSWWSGAEWILCHDDKARRVADARAPLLVNGLPGRVLAWRGFGNAISPVLASEAVAALADVLPPWRGID